MKFIYFGVIFGLFIMSGCDDNKISKNDISSFDSSDMKNLESSDLDKKSYAGLEDVFLDTNVIESNGKYVLLIFGANGCKYCERLKSDIKENENLKNLIKQNFSAYYINLSYSKMHSLKISDKFHNVKTSDLARIYGIYPTPTFVFSTKEGRVILNYPGYLAPEYFSAILDFIKSEVWENHQNDSQKIQEFLQKYLKQS